MSPFVLVHGSSGGSWVWKKLAPLLRAAGHEVHAPTLSGLSDRRHLLGCGIDLTTHINDVAQLLEYEDLSDVILVGNSYAGMVITGVAARAPERLRLVVYLDAYVPEAGQSAMDLWPQERRAYAEQADPAGQGQAQPPPLELFGVTDPGLTRWIEGRMTPHPSAAYAEPVPPFPPEADALQRVFIYCTGNPPTTPDVFGPSAAKAEAQGWDVYRLAAGHLSMLTAPADLSRLLLQIASPDPGVG